ncbi:MAG: type II toxin-antitoxin system Phd/YefM family antitoxin [Caldilineaceae bacterium]
MQSYSIAEARDKFAAIVHTVGTESAIELTRRGEPVAMIVSIAEYRRMKEGRRDFWSVYTDYRRQFNLADLDIDPDDVYADVRDVLVDSEFAW